MVRVPDCGRQVEVAGGEIWSPVACSRLHVIFRQWSWCSLSLEIFKQRLDMYLLELSWKRFLLWVGVWVLPW